MKRKDFAVHNPEADAMVEAVEETGILGKLTPDEQEYLLELVADMREAETTRQKVEIAYQHWCQRIAKKYGVPVGTDVEVTEDGTMRLKPKVEGPEMPMP